MSQSTSAGKVVVITHVHTVPPGDGHQLCLGTQKFSKGRPLALGTVQIMIGVMVLLFGIPMIFNADSLAVYSGFFVWGGAVYITAGSLTVAAGKSFNRCLVNGSLGVSVAAAVCAFTATILYAIDATGQLMFCSNCYPYMTRMQGFSGILTAFHVLMLIVSVVIAGFACNATCRCNTETVRCVKTPGQENAERIPELPAYSSVVA